MQELTTFNLHLTAINKTPTLSLGSSSSEGGRTKVDATPWMYPAYKLFQASSSLVNFEVAAWMYPAYKLFQASSSLVNFEVVAMLSWVIEEWNNADFRFLALPA